MLIMEKARVQKGKNFTQKEAELLTELTRSQLRRLDEIGLVVPAKRPSILYSWQQLVFLKVLSELKQDWSFKQLEIAFAEMSNSPRYDKFIQDLENTLSILLLVDNDGIVTFDNILDFKFDDENLTEDLKKSLEKVKEGQQLSGRDFGLIYYLAEDCIKQRLNEEAPQSRISIRKKTLLIMPCVIRSLYESAEKNKIKNFYSKVR